MKNHAKIAGAVFGLSLLLIPISNFADSANLNPTVINEKSLSGGDTMILDLKTHPFLTRLYIQEERVDIFTVGKKIRAVYPVKPNTVGIISIDLLTLPKKHFSLAVTAQKLISQTIVFPVPKHINKTPNEVAENLTKQNASVASITERGLPYSVFTSNFDLPLRGAIKISSPYGEIRKTGNQMIRHAGVDFVENFGAYVYAINDGLVLSAHEDPIYGKTVILDHGAGITSLYMHLNEFSVIANQKLSKGEILGTVGMSGLANAPHLHLSIKIKSQSVNPLSFIRDFKL